MICPHVITEHAEDAVPYCQICAPQYIAALRARVAVLEKDNQVFIIEASDAKYRLAVIKEAVEWALADKEALPWSLFKAELRRRAGEG